VVPPQHLKLRAKFSQRRLNFVETVSSEVASAFFPRPGWAMPVSHTDLARQSSGAGLVILTPDENLPKLNEDLLLDFAEVVIVDSSTCLDERQQKFQVINTQVFAIPRLGTYSCNNSALVHFRPQYAHGGAVGVEISLVYWRLTPFERLLENMTPLSSRRWSYPATCMFYMQLSVCVFICIPYDIYSALVCNYAHK
jgi:hypothetical protein